MERFRRFFGREVLRARIDEGDRLEVAELEPRYLPEAVDSFDEMEFTAPLEEEKRLVISAVLEEGRIMRLMIGWIGPDDPEDHMNSLDEEALEKALSRHGEKLVRFFEEITAP